MHIVLLPTSPAGWQLRNYTTRFHILGCAPGGLRNLVERMIATGRYPFAAARSFENLQVCTEHHLSIISPGDLIQDFALAAPPEEHVVQYQQPGLSFIGDLCELAR